MTLEDVKAALEKLERDRDVDKVLRLLQVRENPALADDSGYRTAFNDFYRLRQRKQRFYRGSVLRAAASAEKAPSLREILLKLVEETGENHLSFGSKLWATVSDDGIVFDANVAKHFGLPFYPLPRTADWLDKALLRHERLAQAIRGFVRETEWPKMRAMFDQKFPHAKHLPDTRKADLLIWAHEALRRR